MSYLGNAPVFPTESVLPGNLEVTGNATVSGNATISGATNSVGALTENSNNVVNVADTGVVTEGMLNSDYYEEGTWTPALEGLSPTFSTQVGHYTRVGSLVFAYCHIVTATMTMTGDFSGFQINGLPFTSTSTGSGDHNASILGCYDSLDSNMLDGTHAEVAGWRVYNAIAALTATSGGSGTRYADINRNGVQTYKGAFVYHTSA